MKLPKETQQLLVLGVMIFGVGSFSYVKYFWLPLSRRIEMFSAEIKDHNERIEKAKKQAARLPKLEQELAALNELAAEAEKRLPRARPGPHELDGYEALARKDGVIFSEVAPSGSVRRQYYVEDIFDVTASASPANVRRFLADLAREERLMLVTDLQVTPRTRSVVFKLVFYRYIG